jgi:hypothetical protein
VTTRAEQEPQYEDAETQAEWAANERRLLLMVPLYGIYDTGHHELLGYAPYDCGKGL